MKIETSSKKAVLSALWIFLSANYIFCDVLSNMEASVLNDLLRGDVGGIAMSQGFLLAAGISLEIPFAMIVLSRVLRDGANRWVNIAAGLVMAAYQIASFFMGSGLTAHYVFFSAVEIACNLLIVFLASKWFRPNAAMRGEEAA